MSNKLVKDLKKNLSSRKKHTHVVFGDILLGVAMSSRIEVSERKDVFIPSQTFDHSPLELRICSCVISEKTQTQASTYR